MSDSPIQLLLTSKQAATALGIGERLLWSMTAPRGPIPVVRLNRAVRYPLDALRAFVAAQQRGGQE
jgi:hypothetical protein